MVIYYTCYFYFERSMRKNPTLHFASLVIIILFCNSLNIAAQNAMVSGKIITGENNTPLAGVTISSGNKYGAMSEANGSYQLSLPAGKHELQFRLLSFSTVTRNIELTEGQQLELNIKLDDESKLLNTVVISASKFMV